ncbi:MAG: linear amide C-N hydrolase [Provencibacterium sp.]|jgi:hypothetical protein|nr:linear amide C-N hydrolase [Provencibacterium sp.]
MKSTLSWFSLFLSLTLLMAGCAGGGSESLSSGGDSAGGHSDVSSGFSSGPASQAGTKSEAPESPPEDAVSPGGDILSLEPGLSAVRFDGDYGFDVFLAQGGAASDGEVARYLAENLLENAGLDFVGRFFGCSTIAAISPSGDALFGRNFDWNACQAMVMEAHPTNGYASLSTVNMDFIAQGAGDKLDAALKLDTVRTLAALYAPLDGMNEAGLAVSVNMIQDSAVIRQDTGKPDLTTTTAVRLLLDKAASVGEALELLRQYDLHASMGMTIHFALADRTGRSAAVEYVDQEMTVIETPVLTNFYLAPGEKYGVGTRQSQERFAILTGLLAERETLSEADVRDALSRVSKGNFGEFESTEWSMVLNLAAKTARYYHRENYENSYLFKL